MGNYHHFFQDTDTAASNSDMQPISFSPELPEETLLGVSYFNDWINYL